MPNLSDLLPAVTISDTDRMYMQLDSPSGSESPDRSVTPAQLRDQLLSGLGSLRTGANLVMNGRFSINQRAFAGGALGADVYGVDRWKAGAGGCDLSVASNVVTLTGPLVQIIEAPGLAGLEVTISCESPSSEIPVTIGDSGANTASGSIPVGTGRQSVAITVPAGATGDIHLTLDPVTSTVFRDVQVVVGSETAFDWRTEGQELADCLRYFQAGRYRLAGYMIDTEKLEQTIQLRAMRSSPVFTITGVPAIDGDGTLSSLVLDSTSVLVEVTKTTSNGVVSADFTWTANAEL